MQICNSSLKKARDHKRKSFFYSTDGVIQLGSLSKQSYVSSHYFFGLLFRLLISKACLKMTKISPTLN